MIEIIDLGKREYLETLELQKELFNRKINGEQKDFLIIVEHFPVYTKGKTTKEEHIPQLIEDVPVIEIERGGSVTFHGEGQLVVYPILNLKNYRLNVSTYISKLEQTMIETLKEFEIEAFTVEKLRGVFTQKGKIGFLGVKISRYVTFHGFSLNVNVDKKYFEKIVPCGITEYPVTSISDFRNVPFDEVKKITVEKFNELFENKKF